jgi:hypothetical protein
MTLSDLQLNKTGICSRYLCKVEKVIFSYPFCIVLSGVVVSVCLPLDPRLVGSNLAEGNCFLRVIKIYSTFSFGGEVKLSAPFCKILRHVKDPVEV